MNLQYLSLLAGTTSTTIFAASQVPMLVRAYRTKDLRSYSAINIVLANLGNLIHWIYILALPFGPIWFLHGFYTLSTALMLLWYVQHRRAWIAPDQRSFRAELTERLLRVVSRIMRRTPSGQRIR